MNIFKYFREIIITALLEIPAISQTNTVLDFSKITAEPPRDVTHGHIATNAAMVLAKQLRISPIELSQQIAQALKHKQYIQDCAIAGPGFINLTLEDAFIYSQLCTILGAGIHYADSNMGKGEKINVEYVSTNPTGPIHVGHCRGAIIGDVLAILFGKVGYKVTKEYYINDAGSQADSIAISVYARYCQQLGQENVELGEYPGDYLIPVALSLIDTYGDSLLTQPQEDWLPQVRQITIDAMMALITQDLKLLNIQHDIFTSERAITAAGAVDQIFTQFKERDLIYTGVLEAPKGVLPDDWEPRPQELFRASQFGDDTDRPLRKSNNSWTYFATDIAYHFDKFKRGYNRMINVWGADHGGYVKRLAAAVSAITHGKASMEVKLCQMVKFTENGETFKMSKRAGTFISVKDVVERVGSDVIRFMMMTRKNDAPLDFDLQKVVEQSKDNPVFYVQYAYARCCSIKRHAQQMFPQCDFTNQALSQLDINMLESRAEKELVLKLAHWPSQVEIAAMTGEPHRLAYFLHELASEFHSLWAQGKENTALRFIYPDNPELTLQKLALTQAVATVIESGLQVFGVTPQQEMR